MRASLCEFYGHGGHIAARARAIVKNAMYARACLLRRFDLSRISDIILWNNPIGTYRQIFSLTYRRIREVRCESALFVHLYRRRETL